MAGGVADMTQELQELKLKQEVNSHGEDECCKGRECLKSIPQDIKQTCQEAKATQGMLYVSRFIHPHQEGPPDTKQFFIYKIPDESNHERSVCQKAFVETFGLSHYTLQQAQGAAISRIKGTHHARGRGASPQRRESGIFKRLRKSLGRRFRRRDRSPSNARKNTKAKVSSTAVVEKVDFDLAKAQIVRKPQILGKFCQKNNTNVPQSATWKTSQTKTTSRTYELQWEDQTSITAEAEVTVNLPMIGGGEVGLGTTSTVSIGSRQSTETGEVDRWEFELPGSVEPMSELVIELKAEKHEIFVPITAKVRKGNKVCTVKGIYKGTQYLNAEVVYRT